MTTLSKTISHDYDPSIVYHSHSSNVPHLASWINELVTLTEKSYPKSPTPSTDDLVHALQRYDAIFRELLRQTSIFSEPVTKMLAQAWAGVIKLLDYMIKSYHRYVKHTSHLQTQAHNLLNERQRSEAAHKIQKEESDLERTSLRARIRSLESELESMKIMRAGMENENTKMRRIISVYIQSSDLNDPAWEVMEEDDMGADQMKRNQKKSSQAEQVTQDQQVYGFKRKDIIDAGHAQLKTLNRLDVELNEILANVLKEENRQRLLMQSLLKLIDKNKEQFFSADEIAEAEEDWIGIMSGNRKEQTGSHNSSFGRLGSSKSMRRVNSNGPISPSEGSTPKSAKFPAPFTSSLSNLAQNAGAAAGAGNTSSNNNFSDGIMSPSGDSSKAPRMARMNRSSSMVALTTGFAILGSDLNKKCDVGVQVDEKDEFGCVDEEPSEINVEETIAMGVAPLPPVSIHIPGADQPYQLRRRMSTFPKLLRVPPVVWTCTMIMNIYLDKIQMDEERASLGLRKQSLPDHVYDYFMRTTGLRSATDVHVAQLLKACESHNRRQPRIALFVSQMGLNNPEEAPTMDVRDTDFILHVLSSLLKQGELMPDLFKSLKTKSAVLKSSVLLRPDILRISAVHLVQDTFQKWLPDGGDDFVMKAKAMQSTEKGFRYVDVDNLIDLLIDPWHTVRANWEEHARFLFHEFAGVHRVLQEATFANDEGVECTDTVLVEMNKAVAADCLRRPLRLFQRLEEKAGEETRTAGSGGAGQSSNANTNKEPVCEAMNRKQFMECLHAINPAITTQEALDMFQEGLDIAHESVLRVLEVMWMKFIDDASHYNHITLSGGGAASTGPPGSPSGGGGGHRHGGQLHGHKHLGTNKDYWVNMRTQISQWTRPYLRKNFRSQDLEIETFVTVLIRNDVMAKSPLLENIIHLPPKDLWPNAEMFLKQMKDKARRAAGLPVAMTPSGAGASSFSSGLGRSSLVSFSQDGNANSSGLGIKTHLPQLSLNDNSDSDSNSNSSPKHTPMHSTTVKKSASSFALSTNAERVPSGGGEGKKNRDKSDKGDKNKRKSMNKGTEKADKAAASSKK